MVFRRSSDNTEVFYQISVTYQPEYARGVRWNDPAFGIEWPISHPIVSARDLRIRGSQHMSRVLVTGASDLSAAVLPILAAKGYDVHALSRRQLATPLPGLSWHNLDLLSQGAPSEIIHQVQPDFLLHLAWYAAPSKFWEARENIDWVRASLELLLAFAANQGKRIIVAGSCAEYALTPANAWKRRHLFFRPLCTERATPLRETP